MRAGSCSIATSRAANPASSRKPRARPCACIGNRWAARCASRARPSGWPTPTPMPISPPRSARQPGWRLGVRPVASCWRAAPMLRAARSRNVQCAAMGTDRCPGRPHWSRFSCRAEDDRVLAWSWAVPPARPHRLSARGRRLAQGAPLSVSTEAVGTLGFASRLMKRATTASVAVAALMIAIKLVAWILTDSVSLLSSLLDSMLPTPRPRILNLMAVRQAFRAGGSRASLRPRQG